MMDFSGDVPRYVGGFSVKVNVDKDEMSFFEIVNVATVYLKYVSVRKIWYLTPKAIMATGLHEVRNDEDAMIGLLVDAANTKIISVFVEVVDPNDGAMGDNNKVNAGTDFVGQHGNNSVAREIHHVIDSNDAMTSDEDYIEGLSIMKMLGLTMRVATWDYASGEEVGQPNEMVRVPQDSDSNDVSYYPDQEDNLSYSNEDV
ncbi:unnamed protein product [Linum trigynum]|uniref:PB1-like domain-containing protein n=1 Tax=Linum trigynum TaxID=586398 RepID=A0AAV2DBX6_9ROSI